MKTLFPEMDKEIADDRKAAHRESAQQARQWLKTHDFTWVAGYLLEHGPKTEHQLLMERLDELPEDQWREVSVILGGLLALWRVGKLWRISLGIHPGSGEISYCWGLRKVHPRKLPESLTTPLSPNPPKTI